MAKVGKETSQQPEYRNNTDLKAQEQPLPRGQLKLFPTEFVDQSKSFLREFMDTVISESEGPRAPRIRRYRRCQLSEEAPHGLLRGECAGRERRILAP